MDFKSINPTNNQVIASFPTLNKAEIDLSIDNADKAFHSWRNIEASKKKLLLVALSAEIISNTKEFASIITKEMGKPIHESMAEVKKCADLCLFYSANFEKYLLPKTLNEKAIVQYEPLGVIFGIMPWNFPFWQVFRFVIPTILAGNTVIIKHAPNTPQCAISIANLFIKVGFPNAVCQSIFIAVDQVESIIQHHKIHGVSLTGSTIAGRSVASIAGKFLKKCVLELGGNDAFIVTKNANIEKAVEKAVLARCRNNGQSCVAAKRFIIEEEVYDSFKTKLIIAVDKLKIGEPTIEGNTNGPLARTDLFEKVLSQIQVLKEKNFNLIHQLYQETSMSNVIAPAIWEGNEIIDEEIFAPIFLLYRANNLNEMIDMANQSDYGLGTSVWTNDADEIKILSHQVQSGMLYINELVYSDPALPFGGIKNSGTGKELGEDGIKEFTNSKLIFTK